MTLPANPYRPGAGVSPPVLAGRDDILSRFERVLAEVAADEGQRPWVLAGSRGVGKTVLLLELRQRAEDAGWVTAHVEAGPPDSLVAALTRALYVPLRRALARAGSGAAGSGALRRLLAVFSALRVSVDSAGRLSLGVDLDPDAAPAVPGEHLGLPLLLRSLGEWARGEGRAALVTIDELHAAPPADLQALNKALHALGQEDLPPPVHVVAAGHPSLPAALARANPYAERLYVFHQLGPLDAAAAATALTAPAAHLGVRWEPAALARAVGESWGVPYFLQAVGSFAWQVRENAVITLADAEAAIALAFAEAQGMYLARWEGSTPAQQAVITALAALGGEAPLAEVAARLGRGVRSLSRVRADLLARGVVEDRGPGRLRFTLPGFADFVAARS